MVALSFLLLQFFPHSFLFHSIFQLQLVHESCYALPFLLLPVVQGWVTFQCHVCSSSVVCLRLSLQDSVSTSPDTLSCSLLVYQLLGNIFFFNMQHVRAFVICSHFLFRCNFQVSQLISSVVELCNIIFPNFQYLSLIYWYIPLRVFCATVLNTVIFFPTQFLCLYVH